MLRQPSVMMSGRSRELPTQSDLHGEVVVLDDLLHHLDSSEVSQDVSARSEFVILLSLHLTSEQRYQKKEDSPDRDFALVLFEHLTNSFRLSDALFSVRTRRDGLFEKDVCVREKLVELNINVVVWLQTTAEHWRGSHKDRPGRGVSACKSYLSVGRRWTAISSLALGDQSSWDLLWRFDLPTVDLLLVRRNTGQDHSVFVRCSQSRIGKFGLQSRLSTGRVDLDDGDYVQPGSQAGLESAGNVPWALASGSVYHRSEG